MAYFGLDLPCAEDWDFIVPIQTGHAHLDVRTLWTPLSEHRLFLPRLLWYAFAGLGINDMRASMYVNVALLSAAAYVPRLVVIPLATNPLAYVVYAARVATLSMGVAASGERHVFPVLFVVALLIVAAATVRAALADRSERHRAIGLVTFIAAYAAVSFSIAWGRAGFGPGHAYSIRYVTLLVPLNAYKGANRIVERNRSLSAFVDAIESGTPIERAVEEYGVDIHPSPSLVVSRLRQLRDASIGRYVSIVEKDGPQPGHAASETRLSDVESPGVPLPSEEGTRSLTDR